MNARGKNLMRGPISRRGFLRGAALLSGGAALGWPRAGLAAGSDEEALVAAARTEGKGVFYDTFRATAPHMVDAFTKKYGIELELVTPTTAELSQRFSTEAKIGNVVADVIGFTHDGVTMPNFVKNGWIEKLDPSLPNLSSWPAKFRTDYFAVYDLAIVVLAWNTNLVPDGLSDWSDLLDPKWKGQIIASDPRGSGKFGQWILTMRSAYGQDFLEKFAAQDPRVQPSNAGFQQVVAGAAAIFAPATSGTVVTAMATGAPVAFKVPPTTTASQGIIGIAAHAPHPNIGKLLFNFMLSPDGQRVVADSGDTSPIPDFPDQKVPQPKNLIVGNEQEGVAVLPEVLSALGLG